MTSCASASACSRSQRVEVGAELAVGVRHHRRAAAEHGVAGQHGAAPAGSTNDSESDGVAGRADDVHLEAVDRDHVAVAEALGAEPVRRVEGAYAAARPARRTSGPPRSGRGGGGSAARRPTSPACAATASRCAAIARARVDHDRPATRRARAAPRCWCRRGSSCPAFGASTQRARCAERPAGPGRSSAHPRRDVLAEPRPAGRGSRGRRRPRRPPPRGSTASRSRPAGGGQHLGGCGVLVRPPGRCSTSAAASASRCASTARIASRTGSQATVVGLGGHVAGAPGPRAARRRRTRCGEAPRLEDRRQPARPDAEQVGAQHQPAPVEERR